MSEQSPEHQSDMPEPRNLRNLRLLVTTLMATMIIGIIVIVLLIVLKISQPATPSISLPDRISIPAGETAQAFTQGRDWVAVVTIDETGVERIRILALDGSPRQVIDLAP